MALSDCEHCWETPCSCGHQWAKYSIERLLQHRDVIERAISQKMAGQVLRAEFDCERRGINVTGKDENGDILTETLYLDEEAKAKCDFIVEIQFVSAPATAFDLARGYTIRTVSAAAPLRADDM